jgi:hypothetical protein
MARSGWQIAALVALGALAIGEFALYSSATFASGDRAAWDILLPAHVVRARHAWPAWMSLVLLGGAGLQSVLLLSMTRAAPSGMAKTVVAATCGVAAIVAVEAVRAPYVTSNDAYAYIAYAKLESNAQAYRPPRSGLPAPFDVVNNIWGRPLLPAAYGPLELGLYRAVVGPQTTLGGALLATRLVGLVSLVGLAGLVFALTRRAALLPLVIVNPGLYEQTVVNAHNDLLAVDLVLLGVYVARRFPLAGVAVAAASGLMKINFMLIAPAFAPARANLAGRALAYAGSAVLVFALSAALGGASYLGALARISAVYGAYHASAEDIVGLSTHAALAAFAIFALVVTAAGFTLPWSFAWSFYGLGFAVYPGYLVWGITLALREVESARLYLALLPIPSLTCDFLFRGSGDLTRVVFLTAIVYESVRALRARGTRDEATALPRS